MYPVIFPFGGIGLDQEIMAVRGPPTTALTLLGAAGTITKVFKNNKIYSRMQYVTK